MTWTALGILAAAVFGMFAYMATFAARVDSRFDGVNARFDALTARMDARFDAMDTKFDRLAARLDAHIERHAG